MLVAELGEALLMAMPVGLPVEALEHDPVVIEAGLGESRALRKRQEQKNEQMPGGPQ